MKHALIQIACAVATVLAAPATAPAADDDPMAVFYGNTLTIAVPDAYYYARRFIDPDGTWREPRGDGFVRGRWERTPDGKTCHWQVDPPIHNPTRYCYPPERRKVGDEWTTTDPNTGNTVVQKIEPAESRSPSRREPLGHDAALAPLKLTTENTGNAEGGGSLVAPSVSFRVFCGPIFLPEAPQRSPSFRKQAA